MKKLYIDFLYRVLFSEEVRKGMTAIVAMCEDPAKTGKEKRAEAWELIESAAFPVLGYMLELLFTLALASFKLSK